MEWDKIESKWLAMTRRVLAREAASDAVGSVTEKVTPRQTGVSALPLKTLGSSVTPADRVEPHQ